MPTIQQLYANKEIRTRSYRVCAKNGLEDTDQLIAHFKEHGTFRNLKSCGLIVQHELKGVCEYYSLVDDSEPENLEQPIKYADVRSGQRAIQLGHIDLLVVSVTGKPQLESDISQFKGRVGWCLYQHVIK